MTQIYVELPETAATGDGSTTAFVIGFALPTAVNLVVTIDGLAQTAGIDYDVVGSNVVFVSPPSDGAALAFRRSTAIRQAAEFPNQPTMKPLSVEAALNERALVDQELAAMAARAVLSPIGEPGFRFPTSDKRALKVFTFDVAGFLALEDRDTFRGPAGDPGGNVMSVPTFTGIKDINIQLGTNKVITASYDGKKDRNGALLGGGVYVVTTAVGLVENRWTTQSKNGVWVTLADDWPNFCHFGAVPDAVQTLVGMFWQWSGTNSGPAMNAALEFLRSNYAYRFPGTGVGRGIVGSMGIIPGQYLTNESLIFSLDGSYASGGGLTLYGHGKIQSVIIADLKDGPWPALDCTGHRAVQLENVHIRVPRSSLATCCLLTAQAYNIADQQNYALINRGLYVIDDDAPNRVAAWVIQNTDGALTVCQPEFNGGIHCGVAPPMLHMSPVISATATTIRLDAETMANQARCIGMPVVIIHGSGRKKVRRITGFNGTSFTIDTPWNVDPTGYGTTSDYAEDGVSIPDAGSIAEVVAVNSKTRNIPGIQSNQTFYNFDTAQIIGPYGLTIRVGMQVKLGNGALVTAAGALSPERATMVIAPAFSRFWGIGDLQISGDWYTENQSNANLVGVSGIKNFYQRVSVDRHGQINVTPPNGTPNGTTNRAAMFSTGTKSKAWAYATNTGTGVITMDPDAPVRSDAIPDNYDILIQAGGAFEIRDTFGNLNPAGTVGVTYAGQIKFIITGAPDVGDRFRAVISNGQYDVISQRGHCGDQQTPLLNVQTPMVRLEGWGHVPGGLGVCPSVQKVDFTPIVKYGDLSSQAAWDSALTALAPSTGLKSVSRRILPSTAPAYAAGGAQQPAASWSLPGGALTVSGGNSEVDVSLIVRAQAACSLVRPYLRQGVAVGSPAAWAPSTPYAVGAIVTNGGAQQYYCFGAGVSASSGGPSGSSNAAIADGAAFWWPYPFAYPLCSGHAVDANDFGQLMVTLQNQTFGAGVTGFTANGLFHAGTGVSPVTIFPTAVAAGGSNMPPFDTTQPILLQIDTVTAGSANPLLVLQSSFKVS